MPLYKITSKRLARKEREDASGLTDLKAKIFEELGEDDGSSGSDSEGSSGSDDYAGDEEEEEDGSEGTVDSEESSDDEDDEEEEDDAESTLPLGSKRKRPQGTSDGEEEDESASGDEDEDEDEEDDDDDEHEEEESDDDADVPFTLTLDTALTSPIYSAPRSAGAGPDGRLCVLCPGKVLKHQRMVEVHLSSSSHTRALKRYESWLSSRPTDPLSTEDPREVVQDIVARLEEMRAGEGKRADRWQKPRESKKSERRAVLREKKAARRALTAARKAEAESAQSADAARGNIGEREGHSVAEAVLGKGKKRKAGGSDGVGQTPSVPKSRGKDTDGSAVADTSARAAKRLKHEAIRLDAASHGHRRAPRTIRKEARAKRLLAEAVERGEVVPGAGASVAEDVVGSGPAVGDGEQLEGWNRMARRMAQRQGIHLGSGSGWGSKANVMPLGVGQAKGRGQAHGALGSTAGPGTKRGKKEHKKEVKAKREERKVERRRKMKAEKERGAASTV